MTNDQKFGDVCIGYLIVDLGVTRYGLLRMVLVSFQNFGLETTLVDPLCHELNEILDNPNYSDVFTFVDLIYNETSSIFDNLEFLTSKIGNE